MSAPVLLEQGRRNVVYSFYRWIEQNLPGQPFSDEGLATAPFSVMALTPPQILYTISFEKPISTAALSHGPQFNVRDVGLFDGPAWDVNDRVAVNAAGQDVIGRPKQSYFEVTIWGDQQAREDEEIRIETLRDAFLAILENAGRRTEAGVEITPPLRILDFSASLTAPTATNNYLRRNRQSNRLIEAHPSDPNFPHILTYSGMIKLEWTEMVTA